MRKDITLKMTYSPEDLDGGVAYLYLAEIGPGESAKQVEIRAKNSDGVAQGIIILDFSKDGRLLGIEAVAARHVLPDRLFENFPEQL